MTSPLESVFIMADKGAPEAELIAGLGILEGTPARHSALGTARRRFFFANFRLALVSLEDPAAARSEPRLQLLERFAWRVSGASPFGLGVRGEGAVPFPSWPYRSPSYEETVMVGDASGREPLLYSRGGKTPPRVGEQSIFAAPPAQVEHPSGMRWLTAIALTSPWQPSSTLASLQPWVRFLFGTQPLLELTFDDGQARREADLRPQLPLRLHW